MVQKSRLIEKIAELLNEKKLPLIADIRDESAEDVRIVIEPRSRTLEPAMMMEQLFKLTELESRFPMNMNVLVDGVVPRVLPLNEALRQWVDHRRAVLQRRSRFRLGEIEHRLEVLAGMLIVFLNLDEVIRIIREEDEPKEALKTAFVLTDVQANYILDTRLRSLRRLEEMQLRGEFDELTKEKEELEKLLGSEALQWKAITAQIRDLKKKYGPETKLGRRRTSFEDIPDTNGFDLAAAMIEREPITVVVSEKGWIRALKGIVADLTSLQFKGDDRLKISFASDTTAKILVLATDGKVFTLDAGKLPGGRSQGEPIRLMADLEEGEDILTVLPYTPGLKMLVVATDGRGFIATQDEMIGTTRKGKLLLNVDKPDELAFIVPAVGDHVATIGQNRKLVIFPAVQVPEMSRGRGVRLQKYKDGGIAHAKVFDLAEGLSWKDASGRVFNVAARELTDWIGGRGDAGRLPPRGFPKNNKFE
jgi:topoisomerase-4 subunit A